MILLLSGVGTMFVERNVKGEHGTPREYVERDMDLVHWCLFSMREKTE